MAQRYWLVKSEPNTFSFTDLQRSPRQTTCWDGVRNYQARNLLRDEMAVGDLVLFYHSRVEPMAIVGIARVVRAGYPDPSQFDPRSKYVDPDATAAQPRWFSVDLKAQQPLQKPLTLAELRQIPALEDMLLLRRGSRLSVQPVSAQAFRAIVKAGGVRLHK